MKEGEQPKFPMNHLLLRVRAAVVPLVCAAATAAGLLLSPAAVRGAVRDDFAVRIVSPDQAQTWAVGGVTTHFKLFWDDRKGELLALVTFSNSPRVNRYEPLREQQVTFRLPGVFLDESTQTLYTRIGGGKGGKGGSYSGGAVPVATLRGSGFLTERVRPAPGTLIRVTVNRRGVVRVVLNASNRPLRGPAADADSDQPISHWEIDGSTVQLF